MFAAIGAADDEIHLLVVTAIKDTEVYGTMVNAASFVNALIPLAIPTDIVALTNAVVGISLIEKVFELRILVTTVLLTNAPDVPLMYVTNIPGYILSVVEPPVIVSIKPFELTVDNDEIICGG